MFDISGIPVIIFSEFLTFLKIGVDMSIVQRAFARIQAARNTTRGLLFLFPLGMVSSALIGMRILGSSSTPEKGIYGDDPMITTDGSLYAHTAWTLIWCLCVWIYYVHQAETEEQWPKRTSLWIGLAVGLIVGFVSTFTFLIPVIVILLVVVFPFMIYEHPWVLVPLVGFAFYAYHEDMKRSASKQET